MAKPKCAAAPILNLTSMGLRNAMRNAHLAATESAYHAGSVWRHFRAERKECCEFRYYLSNLPFSVKNFASAVRAHWSIENSFHWVLDMTFNEDQSWTRKGYSPDNFALLRRFAINNLTLDTSKGSTRNKRKRAARDEYYLLNGLAAII